MSYNFRFYQFFRNLLYIQSQNRHEQRCDTIYLCHESHRHIEVRGSMRREGAQERVCEDEERRENEREHRDTKRDRIYPAFKDIWDIRCHAMLMDNGESDAFC